MATVERCGQMCCEAMAYLAPHVIGVAASSTGISQAIGALNLLAAGMRRMYYQCQLPTQRQTPLAQKKWNEFSGKLDDNLQEIQDFAKLLVPVVGCHWYFYSIMIRENKISIS